MTGAFLFLVLITLTCAIPLHHISLPPHDEIMSLSSASGLTVNLNTSNGAYTVLVDGNEWIAGNYTAFYLNNKWYSSADKSLVLKSFSVEKGQTAFLGTYAGIEVNWMAGNTPIITSVRSYTGTQAVVFEVGFPSGAQGTSLNTNEDVITAFPVVTDFSNSLNYFTYQGIFASPAVGQLASRNMPGGIEGGPVFLYDAGLRVLAIAAFDNFMTSNHVWSKSLKNDLAFGVNGKVTELPAGFTNSIMLFGGQGIRNTVLEWGAAMLGVYGKNATQLDGDLLIKNLGYWTDHGGYYWYNTEPNKTYQQTIVDIGTYLKTIDLPIHYMQLDSWWYYKGKNDGVYTWTPQTEVFPDGMGYVQDHFNLPFALHNRYFSPDTPYQKNYSMIVEGYCALPQDERLFHDIMALSKTWGNVLYEQDWLITTYEQMESTQNNVSTSAYWLDSMGKAALDLDMTIQYCMELPNHLLQSVHSQAVTQARASGDYIPGNSQWQVGYSSLFIWALGMVPFKDDFWSSPNQPKCYNLDLTPSCYEPNVYLETLVAALTAGPVGPSDQIGKLDRDLVMRTSREDGVLLKADHPAMPLDVVFSNTFKNPSIIQLWEASTTISGFQFFFVLAAQLSTPFTLAASDLPANSNSKNSNFVAFDYFTILSNSTETAMFVMNSSQALEIPTSVAPGLGNATVPIRYYVIAPMTSSGCTILGELGKFITVSKQRVQSITESGNTVTVSLSGAPNEVVDFYFLKAAKFDVQSVTLNASGSGQVVCQN